jgi:hypothetical protein
MGNNIFAGTTLGGVWVSKNDGVSWSPVNQGITAGIPYFSENAIAVYSLIVKENYIFVATGNGTFSSSNNGNNWNSVNTGLTNNLIKALAIKGDTILAGYSGGILMSVNNGLIWSAMNTGIPANTTINTFVISGNNIFAGGCSVGANGLAGAIFMSSDNGRSWSSNNTNPYFSNINALAIIGKSILAATEKGIFSSSNNGQLWSAINNGIPANTSINTFAISGKNIYAGGTISDANGPISGAVFISLNNGISWSAINTGLANDALSISSLIISGNNIFAGGSTNYGGNCWKYSLSK